MRILHLSIGALPAVFGTGGGAIQRRVGDTATEQARRGHDVHVISPSKASGRREIDGVSVRDIACRAQEPWSHLEFQLRAMREIRAWRPHVVHVHSEPEAAIVGRTLGVPMVMQYDNYFFRSAGGQRLAAVYRRALGAFALLLACSEYARRESIAYWDLPADRTVRLPNGVDVARFRPRPAEADEERTRLGIGDRPLILYVGRVCRQKGSDTLLAAYRRLGAGADPPALVIAGPIARFATARVAPDEENWARAIAGAGGHYLGVVPDERLAGLMSAADVFVMPTAELEMQGMAALEAQACGTPVIATDQGGLPETVPAGCGTLVPVGDDARLATAVMELLADSTRLRAFGERSLAHAQTLSWARICDQLDSIYARAQRLTGEIA